MTLDYSVVRIIDKVMKPEGSNCDVVLRAKRPMIDLMDVHEVMPRFGLAIELGKGCG